MDSSEAPYLDRGLPSPPEWQGFVDESSCPKHGWHTLKIPRRRRGLPGLGSIFKSGFKPELLANCGDPAYPEGRLPVITRLLDGQAPHGFQRASNGARQRCHQDGKRLPYYWYEEAALLWQEGSPGNWAWRVPNIDELEQVMGFPPSFSAVPLSPDSNPP